MDRRFIRRDRGAIPPAPGECVPSMDKLFIAEEDLLLDAYRLGVRVFNSGFRPSFIVGLWRGGSSVGIAVQECLQHLGVATDHISLRTSYRGMQQYQRMVDGASQEIRVHGTQYLLESMNAPDGLLIVDDVYSTGLNVKAVIDRLATRTRRNMPHDVRGRGPLVQARRATAPGAFPTTTCTRPDQWLVLALRAERPEPRRDPDPQTLPRPSGGAAPGEANRRGTVNRRRLRVS